MRWKKCKTPEKAGNHEKSPLLSPGQTGRRIGINSGWSAVCLLREQGSVRKNDKDSGKNEELFIFPHRDYLTITGEKNQEQLLCTAVENDSHHRIRDRGSEKSVQNRICTY